MFVYARVDKVLEFQPSVSLFIRVRTNSQAIRTDSYGDSDRLFLWVRLHNRACHYSMSKPNPNPNISHREADF